MNALVSRGFAPTNLTEAIEFSKMLAASSMVPKQYQGKVEDILVAMQWGYEIGLAPLQSLQNIAVISGKPSVYGDAALALVQNSPVCEDVEEIIEGEGTDNPIAICVARRKGRKPVTCRFSVQDAKRAGLWGKQGPWTQYPKRMLQMRARGFALRDAFPDVLKGLITAEEAQDYPQELKSANTPPPAALEHDPVPLDIAQVDLPFKLMLPGDTVYSQHATFDDFCDAYAALVQRIKCSPKYDDKTKWQKLADLRTANNPTRQKLSVEDSIRLEAAIAGKDVPEIVAEQVE